MELGARSFALGVLVSVLATLAPATSAADLVTFEVVDQRGEPVKAAAVVIFTDAPQAGVEHRVTIDQRDERFHPDFTVVQTGTAVDFPNNDRVMHHVYSFSAAKTFELPLYHRQLPSPVSMDEAGMVVIGCNIHDQMIGHILVVDSPYFGITSATGAATLERPSSGERAEIWFRTSNGYDHVEHALDPSTARVKITLTGTARVAENAGAESLRWNEDY